MSRFDPTGWRPSDRDELLPSITPNDRFYLYSKPRPSTPRAVFVLPQGNATARASIEVIARALSAASIHLVEASSSRNLWDEIKDADILFLAGVAPDHDRLVFELHRRGVCTVWVEHAPAGGVSGPARDRLRSRRGSHAAASRRCRFTLSADGVWDDNAPRGGDVNGVSSQADVDGLMDLCIAVDRRKSPAVIVVARTPRTSDERRDLVRACRTQTFPGALDLVLIGPARAVAGERFAISASDDDVCRFRGIHHVDNATDATALLADLARTDEHSLVVLRRGGHWPSHFLAAHLLEHADGHDAIVFGETRPIDPRDETSGAVPMSRRDRVQDDGFLNCTSSNVSFPCGLAPELADLLDAVSLDDPFDIERREIGCAYAAYRRGLPFRFAVEGYIVIEGGAADIASDTVCKPTSIELDLPDFGLVARRWLQRNERSGLQHGSRTARRPLRILSYRWHAPHQYELHKLPHMFTMATGIGDNRFIDEWPYEQRPLRPNVETRPAADIDPREFDLAILHFDENVFAAHLSNGHLNASWGDPLAWLLALPGLPKVAICHGTPPFVGQFAADFRELSDFKEHEAEKALLVDALAAAGVKVVCNSWQALHEWQFKDSRVIWHGFDPQQFPPATYARDVLSLRPDFQRPHYRGAFIARDVARALNGRIAIAAPDYVAPALEARSSNGFAVRSFRAYVEHVRRYSAYLNTTIRSPMPRSRGEAMLIGLTPVTLRNHDVESFIDNDVNGFYADSAEELADYLEYLLRDGARRRRIGGAARRTALDLFNHDRSLKAWSDLIDETVGSR